MTLLDNLFLFSNLSFEYWCLHYHEETSTSWANPYLHFHASLQFSCMQSSNSYSSFMLIIFSVRYLHISQQYVINMELKALKNKCWYSLWPPKNAEKSDNHLSKKLFRRRQLELFNEKEESNARSNKIPMVLIFCAWCVSVTSNYQWHTCNRNMSKCACDISYCDLSCD